jgi:hypothetical protein
MAAPPEDQPPSWDYFGWTALRYAKYVENADAIAEARATNTDISMYFAFRSAARALAALASAAFSSALAASF